MNVTLQTPWFKRLPSPLYKAAAQSWIDKEYPRHLFIETTAACNLTCAYCPRERRGNAMEYSLFQAIVEEATQYGTRSFSLHLFGEPLLYPRLCDAIRYLKDRAHTVLLTTNGTLLNRLVDEIIGVGPDLLLWSWRPEAIFTSETKAKLRQWGKFRVRFIAEVTPKEAYEEWRDWPNVEGRVLHNYGGTIDTAKWQTPNMGDGSISVKTATRWPCYHLWLAPAVAWNGNILLCCADPYQKEVLGHFPEMSIHEAWTGQHIRRIRDSHLRGQYSGICTSCDVWKITPDLFFSWQKR